MALIPHTSTDDITNLTVLPPSVEEIAINIVSEDGDSSVVEVHSSSEEIVVNISDVADSARFALSALHSDYALSAYNAAVPSPLYSTLTAQAKEMFILDRRIDEIANNEVMVLSAEYALFSFETAPHRHVIPDVDNLTETLSGKFTYSSPNYIIVNVESDDEQINAYNLQSAYNAAKLLTPNNAPLSTNNRAIVILPPGKYDFGVTSFILDASFVDIISMCNDPDTAIITASVTDLGDGTIIQVEDDIRVKGITVQNTGNIVVNGDHTDPSAYSPITVFTASIWENCIFSATSNASAMRRAVTYSHTFIDCVAGDYSFGSGGEAAGVFKGCVGGKGSFGGDGGIATGKFQRCVLGYKNNGTLTEGVESWGGEFMGKMEGCVWKVTGLNEHALEVNTGAKVFSSTLIANNGGEAIFTSSPVDITVAQCRLNKKIPNSIINNIATAYNVVDTDIDF